MILRQEYRDEMIDHLKTLPEEVFSNIGKSREEILDDNSIMEKLWYNYQKNVEEFDCDPEWSKDDAVSEVFGAMEMRGGDSSVLKKTTHQYELRIFFDRKNDYVIRISCEKDISEFLGEDEFLDHLISVGMIEYEYAKQVCNIRKV